MTTTHGYAPTTRTLDRQVTRTPQRTGPPEINDVLKLAETLRAQVDSPTLSADLERIHARARAIEEATAELHDSAYLVRDLLDADPAEIRSRVHAAAHDRAAINSLSYEVTHHFGRQLALEACALLAGHCDAAVTAMRDPFDEHLAVVRTAHDHGMTPTTEVQSLLEAGTTKAIAAWRSLPAAVAGLDQIVSLRLEMAATLNYGPPATPVSVVLREGTKLDIAGAQAAFDGTTETVQYDHEPYGSTLVELAVPRVGGAWLALVSAGYQLHLNTADEVRELLATA